MNDGTRFGIGVAACLAIIAVATILMIAADLSLTLYLLLTIVAIVVAVVPVAFFKGTDITVGDETLTIKAPFVDLSIPISTIDAAELRREFDPGLRTYGYGGLRRGSGEFTNDEFGPYTFAGDTSIGAFVVVRYAGRKGRRILVFNRTDTVTTEALYSAIAGAADTGGRVVPSDLAKGASDHRRVRRIVYGVTVAIVAVVAVIVAASLFSGHVDVSMDDDSVTIDATMMHEDILYSDIGSVELRENMDYGTRVGGYGGLDVSSGNFRNDEFGRYRLAVHNDTSPCIVLHLTDGGVVVFNLDGDEATRTFYAELSDRVMTAQTSSTMPMMAAHGTPHGEIPS